MPLIEIALPEPPVWVMLQVSLAVKWVPALSQLLPATNVPVTPKAEKQVVDTQPEPRGMTVAPVKLPRAASDQSNVLEFAVVKSIGDVIASEAGNE